MRLLLVFAVLLLDASAFDAAWATHTRHESGMNSYAVPAMLIAEATVVMGRVVDGSGEALAFASVQIAGTLDGAGTDADGQFSFRTLRSGAAVVRAQMLGFEPAERRVTLVPGDTLRLALVLRETLLTLAEAVVTAQAFTTGETEAVTLGALDVVTTPGASADLLRAIQTFPGVARVDDGAGLFVRGGAPSETTILLDQATVAYPYRYESPLGGAFGIISPFFVKGTAFAAGGFSARHGGALSGVLEMESLDLPTANAQKLGLGLAAVSAGADIVLVPEKLGVRVALNRSNTGLLMRANGQRDRFETVPQGMDATFNVVYRYRSTGQIKVAGFLETNRIAVQAGDTSFEGVYASRTTTGMQNVQVTDVLGDWLVRGSLSTSRYETHMQFGALDLRPADTRWKARVDAERETGERMRWAFGAEATTQRAGWTGQVPTYDDALGADAPTTTFDERLRATWGGAYVDAERQLSRRFVLIAGLRTDAHGRAEEITADPRLSLIAALGPSTRARVAWGIYHQFASADEYVPLGNAAPVRLSAQRAQHLIAGVTHERGLFLARAEAYAKPYRDLVLENGEVTFGNAGRGHARGLDLFAKYGAFLRTRMSGHIAYSYLDAERRQIVQRGADYVLQDGPAPFDVTHTLNVVAKRRLVGFLRTGLAFTYATGRPHTPIVGAEADDGGTLSPVEGTAGSERLPAFVRLDASLSYYWIFSENAAASFYLSFNNLFDRANASRYVYAADYASRSLQTSTFRRSVYIGVVLLFGG